MRTDLFPKASGRDITAWSSRPRLSRFNLI
jgi:hypothetical protein